MKYNMQLRASWCLNAGKSTIKHVCAALCGARTKFNNIRLPALQGVPLLFATHME